MTAAFLPMGCAVCFGDPNSMMTKAVWPAVFFLMIVVVSVLSVIGWTAFQWSQRSKALGK